jgi:hypothetical protein
MVHLVVTEYLSVRGMNNVKRMCVCVWGGGQTLPFTVKIRVNAVSRHFINSVA